MATFQNLLLDSSAAMCGIFRIATLRGDVNVSGYGGPSDQLGLFFFHSAETPAPSAFWVNCVL